MGSTTHEQNETQPNALIVRTEPLAHAHELFHAVQYAYASFQNGRVANWVREGTAEAIGRTWSKASAHQRLSKRDFSKSLHRRAPPVKAYDDEAFWRAVSREYTSGETYEYLVALFEGVLESEELAAVDRNFREELGLHDGLAEAYPQVVARHLNDKRYYGNCTRVPLRPGPGSFQMEFTVQRFADVAAMCWEIELDGFKDAVALAVTTSYRPGTEVLLGQLTAVMADDSRRIDRAIVRTINGVPEAGWYYDHFGAADTTVFLLTNVADEPDETRELANLSVTFRAFETDALVRVWGPGVSGGSGGSGVSGAAGPDFEVTEWWYSVEGSDQVAETQAAYGQPAPPGNACRVSLTLTSQDANGERLIQVPLHGWVPAPLAPGVWPLVPGHVAMDNPFGVFQTNVGLSCELGGCYEYDWAASSGWDEDDDPPAVALDTLPYLHMTDFHGEVEIQDVSRSRIAGRFDITASAGAKYVGLNLNGVFNVTLGGPRSVGANRITIPEDHQCAPPDPDSRSGAGGRGGRGDQGGGDEGDGGGDDRGAGDRGGGDEGKDDPGGERDAREGQLRGSQLILDFVENQRSVLRSEPQAVTGTSSVGGVDVSSTSYDLTVALPIFGCSVKPPEGISGLELVEYQRTHNRWLQSGRNTGTEILFDFTTADVRLDATTGEVVLELESPEGGATLRGTTENSLSLRTGGPGTIIGEGSDLTLEMTRGEDTFSCVEPMSVSFRASEAR